MKHLAGCETFRTLVFTVAIVIIINTIPGSVASSGDIPSPKTSLVYGPGLRPHDIVLPCRHFNIELRNEQGNRINNIKQVPKNLEILILGNSGRGKSPMPIRHEIFQAGNDNGSFIVRYKTYSNFLGMEISVKLNSQHLPGSPVMIKDPVSSSTCHCPRPHFDEWFFDFQCPGSHPQIDADLAPFKSIDMREALKEAQERFRSRNSFSFCHYAIKANKIYRQCFGEHVGFKMFPDATLSFLSRIVTLPDVEFLINLGDWPLVHKRDGPPIPIISWCKTNETSDVLLPTYELTEATTECMGRQVLDMLSVQGNANVDWDDRIGKAFFKGRDSSEERLDLVRLARKKPDLIEAGITKYFFFRDIEKELGTVNHTSFFDFFKFKYLISMDGTVAAYRFPFLMAGGSLIFKQQSAYLEHFYNLLEPWVHYVPVKADVSDLIEKINWARDHESEARKIAENAKTFANQHLLPKEIICYHALLLKEWAKRQKYKSAVTSQMERVEEASVPSHMDCTCYKRQSKNAQDNLDKIVAKEEL